MLTTEHIARNEVGKIKKNHIIKLFSNIMVPPVLLFCMIL